MAGSALVRRLRSEDCEILTVDHKDVDLRRQTETEAWVLAHRPDVVFLAAGKVGGILANNTYPADFLYDNLTIASSVIHAAHLAKVEKLLFLGSSCIYPRAAAQPMKEAALLSGALEPTNEAYAIAKITGIKMCSAYRRQYGDDFIAAMPTNLFGPGDNFDIEAGHVVAGLIVKAHRAKQEGAASVELWGTGTPLREFLYVDDLADGCVFLLEHYSGLEHVNLGSNLEYSIRQLAETVCKVVGFKGGFVFDSSKPDGMPRKLMDSTVLTEMGWHAKTSLEDGLTEAYRWYQEHRLK